MEHKQLLSLIADIAPVLKDFVSQSFAPLASRIDDIDKRLSSLPLPVNGKDADPDQVASLVFLRLEPEVKELKNASELAFKNAEEKISAMVAELPVKVNAATEDFLKAHPPLAGKDGLSVTIDDVALLIAAEADKRVTPELVKTAVLGVPEAIAGAVTEFLKANPPEPGKDGSSVSAGDLEPLIAAEADKRVTPALVKAAVLESSEAIAGAVAEFLKANPPPSGKDGSSVILSDLEPIISAETDKRVTPALVKAAVLESPEAIAGAVAEFLLANPPPAGKDGLSVVLSDLEPIIAAETDKRVTLDRIKTAVREAPEVIAGAVAEFLLANPPSAGKDGSSVSVSDLEPLIAAEADKRVTPERVKAAVLEAQEVIAGAVAEFLKANPPPPGKDGSSVSLSDLQPLIAAEADKMVTPERVKAVVELSDVVSNTVAKFLKENPPSAGLAGKDGVGLSGAIIDRDGELIVTMSNGTNHKLGCVVGKDAPPATVELLGSSEELDDDVAKQVAAAVRLLAELPDTVKNDAPAATSETHIHMPDIIVPEIKHPTIVVPEIKVPETVVNVHVPEQKAPVVNITTPTAPAPIVNIEREKRAKKTRTVVKKHDAKGRVLEFEQEEL